VSLPSAVNCNDMGHVIPVWVQSLCGALAGGICRLIVAPLDVIKIRLQIQSESKNAYYRGICHAANRILREEGIGAFWRGSVPALLLWIPFTATQFAALGAYDQLVQGLNLFPSAPFVALVGGMFASLCATVVSYPFDLLRTVLVAQGSHAEIKNIGSALSTVLKRRGTWGLYAGLLPTIAEILPASGTQFAVYNMLTTSFQTGSHQVVLLRNFYCGSVAGTASRILVHPLDVMKKRFQIAGLASKTHCGQTGLTDTYRNILDCAHIMFAQEGLKGFYKGLFPAILKSAPASGLTFFLYEALVQFVTRFGYV